VYEHTCHC